MIEGVAPVARMDPVTLSVAASLASRQGTLRRQKRLRWLAALNDALGDGAASAEDHDAVVDDECILAQTRDRIAAALGTIEELRGLSVGPAPVAGEPLATSTITAAELALRIVASAEQTLCTQARLGPASVRELVGASSRLAVNGV